MLVNIAFGTFGQQGHANTAAQIFAGMPTSSENLTTSTTTTAAASATSRQPVAFRISTDTAIYVSWGSAPDSSSGTRIMMPANTVEYFGCNHGDKVDITAVA